MKAIAMFFGLVGLILMVDAVLSIGFGEKYISFIVDYAPMEYVAFAYDLIHSPIETQLFMRVGEIFMGYILMMLAQGMGD
jgi:hypothetical protein